MPLLVVGSVAFDSVETPHGVADDALGGSATFFSYAASFFTPVRLVGVVGEDFPRRAPRSCSRAGTSTPRAWSSRRGARPSAGGASTRAT